jgi:translation initiation factor 3 subunit B
MEEYAVGSAAGPQGSLRWPFFKWAGGVDDQYFARLGKGKVGGFSFWGRGRIRARFWGGP